MKKQIIHITTAIITLLLTSCGNTDFIDYDEIMSRLTFPSSGSGDSGQMGNDVISKTTNQSDKKDETSPKLSAYSGAGFVKPPSINNYGTVNLSYPIDVPPGRAGMQPGVGLSYSSSGGDGLVGIGWSMSTGLGVISRTTRHGQLYYDYRDTFTFNGKRLIKVSGQPESENGTYRLEIESGFSKFMLSDAESGGVWQVLDKGGALTVFGDDRANRIYHPDDETKTYIWNFSKSVDLNGNFMTAIYDDSEYEENHILYLKEIRYSGNEGRGLEANQYVRFHYDTRDESYVSKAPGFIMKMDRMLDYIEVGWDDPAGFFGSDTELWRYKMAYETSEDSGRPLLKTVESTRNSTEPEFIYQEANHLFVWSMVNNTRYNDTEVNPDATKYFEGDFNGDGISDMVFFNPETGYWRASEGNRNGGYYDRIYGQRLRGYDSPSKIQWFKGNVTGDYNGDGRSDIAYYLPETKEFWVAEHNGHVFNFRNYGRLNIDIDIFKCEWFTGDYDGNGLSDAVLFHEPTGEWLLMTNMGGSFNFIKFSEHFQNLFRGDYTPDMNMDSPSTSDFSDHGRDRGKVHFLSGDYNGDGRTDISIYDSRSGRWWVAENYRDDAIGFRLEWRLYKEFTEHEKSLFAPREASLAGNDRFSGDFNGDGFSDFLIFHKDSGEWIIGETGNGTIDFRVFSRAPRFKDITRWLQGDFNGDGRTDIGFFSKTDNNFWVGEATRSGFRYRIYNNLSYCSDPDRILKTPLPKDEIKLTQGKSVIANDAGTALVDYQYDGNYHTNRGEKVFTGYFTGSGSTPELLIYKRAANKLYLKQGNGGMDLEIDDIDLDSEGIKILNNEMPDRYRTNNGIIYYKKRSSFGSDKHTFNIIHNTGTGFTDEKVAEFTNSRITDFNIDESIFCIDRFEEGSEDKHLLILDDMADTPKFALITGADDGDITDLQITNGDFSANDFKNIRNIRNSYRFFSGKFTTSGRAQALMVDMTQSTHRWYIGSITGDQIAFTRLSGNPRFIKSGYTDTYRVVDNGMNANLIYATVQDGRVSFHKLEVGSGNISRTNYSQLAKGITFKNEFDHEGNPVVHTNSGLKKALLESTCRLVALNHGSHEIKRPDLMEEVYPFRWIQGDYNGDGKTDIGIFHLKERNWYFALTVGTVPDMISVVKNGIGGVYRMEYVNSTSFDNRGGDGIPDLPMNYKVCNSLTVEDSRGASILTRYEYKNGYAFSAFINGYKETDYFGFGNFTVIDAAGARNKSEYHNAPYDDFRRNRALAGAVRETRIIGSDNVEYGKTEYEYRLHEIVPSPPAPLPGGEGSSFLIEPVKVRKYVKGALTETRESNIELEPGKYEMKSKTESVTDHYQDGVHSPVGISNFSEFENIESTNEMRLKIKRNFDGASNETTSSYEYDSRGNLITERSSYSGSGLPSVSDRVMNYEYDGYGNRIREIDASGSPSRIVEKSYDTRLRQFVVQERAIGDSITLITGYDINYESAFGGISRKTDPNGYSTYFEYDSIGRLERQYADTDSGKSLLNSYTYNVDFPLSGKVTQYTGTGGTIETRVYADGMGRTIHSVRSATDKPGKRYTKTGKIVYDRVGRIIRKSQTSWADDYEIDVFKKNYREKYPTVTEYDGSGRVKKLTLPQAHGGEGETSTIYAYNDPWEVIATHSVGRSKRTVKNARGQVLYIEDSGTGDDGQSVNASIGFAYDIAGNRVKKMDLNDTGMDISVPSPPAPLPGGEGGADSRKFERGYSYAKNGNLTGKTIYDPETSSVEDSWSYVYNNHAATRIDTTKSGERFVMHYDAVGNMISQQDNEKNLAKEMAYDSYNRIKEVTDPDTGNITGEYWYDDQGFRVRKVAETEIDEEDVEVEVLYPSIYFCIETQSRLRGRRGSTPIKDSGFGVSNIYLNGVRIAAVIPNGEARYYLTDQVDSVKVVVDDNGKAVTRTEYLPYGETWFQEGDDKNAPKYNSQELDKETNFYFYNARHYDPEISRFVTADNVVDGQYDTQGWNRFSYTHNNPILYKDPTGHWHMLGQLIDAGIEKYKEIKQGKEIESNDPAKEYCKGGVDTLKAAADTAAMAIDPGQYGSKLREGFADNLQKEANEYLKKGQDQYIFDKLKNKVTKTITDFQNNPMRAAGRVGMAVGLGAGAFAASGGIQATEGLVSKIKDVFNKTPKSKIPFKPTLHSVEQKIQRGIKSIDELDAIKNPLKITDIKFDKLGRPSKQRIGKKATISVNPKNKKITSVWSTSSKKAKKLMQEK